MIGDEDSLKKEYVEEVSDEEFVACDTDYDDEEEYVMSDDEYDSEIEAAITKATVERRTAIDMMESFIESTSDQYGLLRDSEMNVIYAMLHKARDRVDAYCRSDEFIYGVLLANQGYDQDYDDEDFDDEDEMESQEGGE